MKKLYFIIAFASLVFQGCIRQGETVQSERLPYIFPDYIEVTVPVNIAPVNFSIDEKYEKFLAEFTGIDGKITIRGKGSKVQIPAGGWKSLTAENAGGKIDVDISILKEGRWTSFRTFSIYVSGLKADEYLVYRRIMPGYQNWNSMGIYQRNISSFDVKTIIDSKVLPGTCMNCHSFSENDPSRMVFHLRESYGGTMLYRNGNLEKLNTRTGRMFANAAFPSWHPSGNYIAFSVNRVNQIFHAAGDFRAAAVDMKSDVFVYDIEKNEMLTSPALSGAGKFESFPCFSPDGKRLYYCSADSVMLPQKFDSVRYSLCAVEFNELTGKISDRVDTVLSLKKTAKSIALPRVSPDGRFLMFTEADYGCFPSYNPEAELRLLDLSSGEVLKLDELNSDNVESWHTWSSEGRWVAFSSRREDGLTSNVYLAYIDEQGKGTKPFLLPQKDPAYYRYSLDSFNVPEFIKSEVKTGIYRIEEIARTRPALQVGPESGH